jgi:hypothetical protein
MTRHPRLDIDLWARCRSQGGMVDRDDLVAAGLTDAAIAHRVGTGRLWPCFGGTQAFAVGRPDLPAPGLWRAALATVGDDAALSLDSAVRVWELRQDGGVVPVHVSVPTQAGRRSRPDLIVHRAATLTPDEIELREDLRVTSLHRTLLDLSLVVTRRELRALLREAEYRHRLNLPELRRGLDGHGRSPAHGRLRRVLDEWVPGIALTENELEATFMELCARHSLPLPVPQARRGNRRPDFVWPELMLIVEIDGYDAHSGRIAFQDDRAKDRALQAEGFAVLRFTWAEVVMQPRQVAHEVRRALARRDFELKSRMPGNGPS